MHRGLRFVLLAAAVGILLFMSRSWPREQVVHFVLGEAAGRVDELRVHYSKDGDDEAARGAEFHYAPGKAPRIVTDEPRLANGEYEVEVEIVARGGAVGAVTRRVSLQGGSSSIELSRAVPE